jgi:CBS-domain-containing membrane protein
VINADRSKEAGMVTAANVMTSAVVTVRPETPLQEAAKLLYTRHISRVPVIADENRVIGIVSEGDLIGHARVAGEQHRSLWHVFRPSNSGQKLRENA